jgi:hypothetical protein
VASLQDGLELATSAVDELKGLLMVYCINFQAITKRFAKVLCVLYPWKPLQELKAGRWRR